MRIETQREKTPTTLVQLFINTQGKCEMAPKLVKCSEGYWFYGCPNLKPTIAKFANLRKSHPANYRGHETTPQNDWEKKVLE